MVAEAEAPAPAPPRSGGGGLARADPLSAYMAEVQRHPLLTREEEGRLARLYRVGGRSATPRPGWSPPTCAWW